jgi:methyltransferase (TIGR00027 family)
VKPGRASRTAQHMALFRAMESSRPPRSRLFYDPFATLFLKPSFQLVLALSRLPILGKVVPLVIDTIAPGARSSAIARTRLIDDQLQTALRDGLEQLVILGAGYDCRAYRMLALEQVRTFEVDHPDTLAEKRRALPTSPSHVRFVSVDFNLQSAGEALAAVDYSPVARTFFIWEGVTNYLTAPAVDKTVRWLGTAAPGSWVAITYVHRDVLEHPEEFYGATRLLQTFERLGEPWLFGLDPAETASYLGARGLSLVEDIGAAEYRSRYLTDRGERMRGYEFYRVAFARVATEHEGVA